MFPSQENQTNAHAHAQQWIRDILNQHTHRTLADIFPAGRDIFINQPLVVSKEMGWNGRPFELDFGGARIYQTTDDAPILIFVAPDLQQFTCKNVTLSYVRLQPFENENATALLFDGPPGVSGIYDCRFQNVRIERARRGIETKPGVPIWDVEFHETKILGSSGASIYLNAHLGMPAVMFSGNTAIRQYVQEGYNLAPKAHTRNYEPALTMSACSYLFHSLTFEGVWDQHIYADSSQGVILRMGFEWARRTKPGTMFFFADEQNFIGTISGSDFRIVEANGPIIKDPETGGAIFEGYGTGGLVVGAATLYAVPGLAWEKGNVRILGRSLRQWPPGLPDWAKTYEDGSPIDRAHEKALDDRGLMSYPTDDEPDPETPDGLGWSLPVIEVGPVSIQASVLLALVLSLLAIVLSLL